MAGDRTIAPPGGGEERAAPAAGDSEEGAGALPDSATVEAPSDSLHPGGSGDAGAAALADSATVEAPSDSLRPGGSDDTGSAETAAGQHVSTWGGEDQDQHIGKQLAGRYTVLERIGRGGMSVVYLARHDLLKKMVAIKLLRDDLAARRESASRFHREAMAAAAIGDPHIVDITDYGFTERGDAFIVMERLEGWNLRETVSAEGALQAGRALSIARQILRALAAAHDRGIIHRDLKSDNVFLLQRDGQDFVKLLDFGISKMLEPLDAEGETGLTSTGQVLGTPQYLAPEQAHGIEHVDHRADIYAMGVILYEMLTGELPFAGKSAFEVVMKHVQEQPQPPRKRRPDLKIPEALERVVLHALEKDPDRRYGSAEEMIEALPEPTALTGGLPSVSLPQAATRRRRALALYASVALVLGASLGTMVLLRGDGARRSATTERPRPAPAPVVQAAADARAPDARPIRPDAAAQAAEMVTLSVAVTPPIARVYLDGELIGRGSVAVFRPASSEQHTLRVVAPGHEGSSRPLVLDRSHTLEINLPRRRPGGAPRPASKKPGDLQQNPYR